MASLYQQTEGGTWYCNLWIGGRRVRKALDTDKREAQRKLLRMMEDRDASRYNRPMKDMTWAEWKVKFLAWSKGEKKPNTHLRDLAALSALESFHKPAKPQEITTELLDRFKHFRKDAGKGHATINRDLNAIKAMMRKASEWGVISKDSIPSPKGYKEVKGRLLFYTFNNIKQLLKVCRGDWKTMCLLGARAGLRRSEMYHLTWKDVDLERGMVSVTPKQGWEPKDCEVRHVPIPDDLKSHLRGLRRDSEWVLADHYSLTVMSTYFRKLCRKVGLRGGLHTLRHSYASHLAGAGVSLYAIAKLLGHADVSVTTIYAHLSPDAYGDAVDRLPDL